MEEYARQCGLRRWMISVPVLTPRLSSLWLGLVISDLCLSRGSQADREHEKPDAGLRSVRADDF